MASIGAARGIGGAVSILAGALAGALAGCSGETAGQSGGSGPTTTSVSSSGGGGTASVTGSGGAGGSGAGGATASSGGGGTGGSTASSGGGGAGGSGGGDPCSTFAQRYGSGEATDEDLLAGAVVDAAGGVIVAGELSGSMSVGAKTLASAGAKDAFVVKLGPGGGVAWAKRIGALYDDRVKGLAATADGGAVLVGTFDGVVDFGGVTLTSIAGPDAFVLRLSASGALVFVVQIAEADARAVAVDESGDVLVAGDFAGTASIGGIELAAVGARDVFVARLGQDGQAEAARQITSGAKPGALAIAAGAGRTYLAGSFQSTIDFGSGALTSAGSRDVFVARLDPDLETAFAERYGDDTSQEARAIAVMSDGSAALAGSFRGTLAIDGLTLVADTQDDAFVARIDEAGAAVFARRFGDAGAQIARAIAVDESDGLVLGGGFGGAIDFGDGPLTSAAGEDVFAAWLDAQGNAVKSRRWGGAVDQRARAVAVDPCGAVVIAGDFNGSLPFEGTALDASGGVDVFVARLAP